MSKIIKNGFYLIDESFGNEISIAENIFVGILLWNSHNNIKIHIGKDSKVEFFGFFQKQIPEYIDFYQKDENSLLQVRCLCIGEKVNLSSHITSHIETQNTHTNIHVISIVGDKNIHIDSALNIGKNSKKIDAHLALENICIGEHGSISSLPNLLVASNDVKVSHSSKTQRMDENKLFYLTSRGIGYQESMKILLESYFTKHFGCIEMYNKEIFQPLQESFRNLN